MTTRSTLHRSAVQALGGVMDSVLASGDAGYDEARSVWNARFDRRPDVVVRCRSAAEVGRVVDLARGRGLTLSVKGGGHSYAGKTVADGGLLIDLSLMRGIRIDAEARTADVEAGVTCGELDRAAQQHGLATPLPTVSSVGVAGAALGGGSGYLSRKYGLTLDNLLSVDLVTADGRQLRVSEADHSDLFWAVRGAGTNFGVATSLRLRLHEVGSEVLAGPIIYPLEGASATPFAGRRAKYGFHVLAGWMDAADDGAVMRWARGFHDAMAPHGTDGVYVNVLGDGEDDRVPAAYGDNYARLVDLKAKLDPDNLFRMHYNIRPQSNPRPMM